MPWHYMAKKDVTTCEKLRRVGSEQRLADIRMGEPAIRKGIASCDEENSCREGRPREVKHLST